MLDPFAFVGRGPTSIFRVHAPDSDSEKDWCRTVRPDQEVTDESGKGRIPTYVATPGAEQEPVPPVQSLPCYVLNKDGLTVDKNTEKPFPAPGRRRGLPHK